MDTEAKILELLEVSPKVTLQFLDQYLKLNLLLNAGVKTKDVVNAMHGKGSIVFEKETKTICKK